MTLPEVCQELQEMVWYHEERMLRDECPRLVEAATRRRREALGLALEILRTLHNRGVEIPRPEEV